MEQISSLLSHGLPGGTKEQVKDSRDDDWGWSGQGDNDENETENSSEFTPVAGSAKAFPPGFSSEKESFSQPADSEASSSLWTPHLVPPNNKKGEGEEKSSSKFTKEQLDRFKDLLKRQKRIKQGFLKSL